MGVGGREPGGLGCWCVLDNLMTHFYDRRVEHNQETVIRAANVMSVSPYLTRLSWSILRSSANRVTVYAGPRVIST